jgi:uncharacterized membrane protein
MLNSRIFRLLATSILTLICLGGIISIQVPVLAQTPSPSPTPEASPTPAPKLTLDCQYPAVSAEVGQVFTFSVDVKYTGTDRQTFNLVATAPSGWSSAVTGTGTTQVSQVQIAAYDANTPGIQTITVSFTPDFSQLPAPGAYNGSLKVTNGALTETMPLRATVTPTFNFALNWTDPSSGSTTTDVTMLGTPGKVSSFPFNVTNSGSADIKNLTFTAQAPKGWTVTFSPASLSSLTSNQTQPVTADVTPASGPNMAGDYVITLKGDNGTVSAKMTLRINIPAATTSVWVIVGVAAIVIAILVGAYQLLGKKKAKVAKS